jgi:hypothetical protein
MGSNIRRPIKKIRNEQKIKAADKKATKRQETLSARKQKLESTILKREAQKRNIFPYRKIDLTERIPVMLNHKTTAYVKFGTNIEKLKHRLNIK